MAPYKRLYEGTDGSGAINEAQGAGTSCGGSLASASTYASPSPRTPGATLGLTVNYEPPRLFQETDSNAEPKEGNDIAWVSQLGHYYNNDAWVSQLQTLVERREQAKQITQRYPIVLMVLTSTQSFCALMFLLLVAIDHLVGNGPSTTGQTLMLTSTIAVAGSGVIGFAVSWLYEQPTLPEGTLWFFKDADGSHE